MEILTGGNRYLTHWVEAVPAIRAMANTVSMMLLGQIIPWYGMVNRINSDRGTHFIYKVLQQIVQALGVKWDLHTLWRPRSSRQVERMNQPLKRTSTKLMIETQMSWIRCLPLTLLWVRTQPQSSLNMK